MELARIYADFQNLDNENRLRLTCSGTLRDLARQKIQLRDGLVLTFYMDDADDDGKPDQLLAEGTVHFNEQEACWVAAINWSARRHASDQPLLNAPTAYVPNLSAENPSTKHS
jgi:hypothetical protein